MASPPPPPPHGSQHAGGGPSGGLPPGKYDIFVIPPHSSGSGFLYLPSLQPQRNSFLAGVACTLAALAVWTVMLPTVREIYHNLAASGGISTVMMLGGVGVAGWAWGKTQMESGHGVPRNGGGSAGGAGAAGSGAGPGAGPGPSYNFGGTTPGPTDPGPGPQPGHMPGQQTGGMPGQQTGGMPGQQPHGGAHTFTSNNAHSNSQAPPPKPSWQRAKPATESTSSPKGAWEKAREEARKREEERKRAEELKKKAEELLRKREEEEKERARAREREARERREREAREKSAYQSTKPSPKRPPNPTVRTEADEDSFSYRPYDKPKPVPPKKAPTASSSGASEFSYAQSHSTRASTPPPSRRGPYSTVDPDKIMIKAVYAFNHAFNNVPVAQLVSGSGSVTDGLILRITTEGLFIDDDVRGVPQREWDVKAWTMKLVEVCLALFPRLRSC